MTADNESFHWLLLLYLLTFLFSFSWSFADGKDSKGILTPNIQQVQRLRMKGEKKDRERKQILDNCKYSIGLQNLLSKAILNILPFMSSLMGKHTIQGRITCLRIIFKVADFSDQVIEARSSILTKMSLSV